MRTGRARLPPSALKPPPRGVVKAPPVYTPKPPPAGEPPHPRRWQHVRDPSGGYMGDLFAIFPELPWAARPRLARRPRTLAARLRRF